MRKEKAKHLWCQSCREKNVPLYTTEVLHEVEPKTFDCIHHVRLCENCYNQVTAGVNKLKTQ